MELVLEVVASGEFPENVLGISSGLGEIHLLVYFGLGSLLESFRPAFPTQNSDDGLFAWSQSDA